MGISLEVQWLRFCAAKARGVDPIPGQGTKIPYAMWCGQKISLKKRKTKYISWSHKKVKVLVVQLCPALCNPMDCSPPVSSVHGIFQARRLERVAIFFSRGSSGPRDRTLVFCVSCIGRQILLLLSHKGSADYNQMYVLYKHFKQSKILNSPSNYTRML